MEPPILTDGFLHYLATFSQLHASDERMIVMLNWEGLARMQSRPVLYLTVCMEQLRKTATKSESGYPVSMPKSEPTNFGI